MEGSHTCHMEWEAMDITRYYYIMNDNQITTLTEKDITELQGFKQIDMRNNPLNCTSIHADILKVIVSDYNLKETPSQHSYLIIRTRETLPLTTRVQNDQKK
jgi:hypothetical protein